MKISIRNKKKDAEDNSQPARITNDTLAEHREKIISSGRRFKYPLQYAKHKIVINTILVSIVAVIALALLGWWQIYIVKNSSDVFYRVTQILPLPVAKVDGQYASFSDFLLNYRASKFYLSKYDDLNINSAGGKQQLALKEKQALDIAIADAYATKIATQHNIKVSDKEIQEVLDNLRSATNGQVGEQTSEQSTERVLGMSAGDLRTTIYNSILRAKAAFAIDSDAKASVEQAQLLLKSTSDFSKVADKMTRARSGSADAGTSGMVSESTLFSGLDAAEIAKLPVGQVSGPMQSITDDGYFFVRVVKKTDQQVSFEFLHIPLHEFDQQIESLKKAGKVDVYIKVANS